jgi:hypothetical protein
VVPEFIDRPDNVPCDRPVHGLVPHKMAAMVLIALSEVAGLL